MFLNRKQNTKGTTAMSIKANDTDKRKKVCDYHLRGHTKRETCIKHEISRPTLDSWLKRYDGRRESLADKSKKPRRSPKQCRADEEQLVIKAWTEVGSYGGDYVYGILLREKGFKRHISTMYRILKKYNLIKKEKPKPRRENQPYDTAKYPGEKLQLDVKYVPKGSLSRDLIGQQWYQYTIIDEATGMRYLEWYQERTGINTVKFLINAMKFFPFGLHMIQTDNGSEFINEIVENAMATMNLRHKRIRPATPRHNGKVERSHRVDGKFFYDGVVCESLEELREMGRKWNEDYNNMYMRKFNWLSPNEVYEIYRQNPKKAIKKRNLTVEKLKQVA